MLYLISMIPGLVFADIIIYCVTLTNNLKLMFSMISSFSLLFDSFLSLYIWLFNVEFRNELFSVLSKFAWRLCFHKSLQV